MIYLNEKDILEIGINWDETINVINESLVCLKNNDFAQPIKPYLRYKDLKNRIIAMPAYLGGQFDIAGLKWIASFPDNIAKNIPRAHSVTVLNNSATGEPVCIINTALLSIIRTASVTGMFIKHFTKVRKLDKIKLGIIGFGPIGQHHLKMCQHLFGDQISKTSLYDIRPLDKNSEILKNTPNLQIVNSWEDAYLDADVFITCTVSKSAYIDKMPKAGSLHLNVSLRDYKTDVYDYFKDSIIVDNWEEVCRENTDIERLHIEKGLKEENTKTIIDLLDNCLASYNPSQPIMFNPMGMGIFDIAIGKYFYQKAKEINKIEL